MTDTASSAGVAAAGSPRCVVALDLRRRSRIAAVAVDRKGRLRAWASVDGQEGPAALAKRVLATLKVQPKELRVLLGSTTAQVAGVEDEREPDPRLVAEALAAEGYEPLLDPAVARTAGAPGTWMVAGCEEERVRSLAAELSELVALEPTLVVDRLLLLHELRPGAMAAESGTGDLLLVARLPVAAPLSRSLGEPRDAEGKRAEMLRTVAAAGGAGHVWLLGAGAGELEGALAEEDLDLRREPMPVCRGQRLPAEHELAWRLALAVDPPALGGPRLDRRRRSMAWARRTAIAAIVLAAVSAVVVGLITTGSLRLREQQAANREKWTVLQTQVEQLQEASAVAQEVERIRSEIGTRDLPWPRLAEPIATLARQSPPSVGWERLTIDQGELELEISAYGASAWYDLALARAALERGPGLRNLSWDQPVASDPWSGLRQVVHATLVDVRDGEVSEAP